MSNIRLERVTYLPKQLESGILYVSTEYSVAGHLCACGCGSKVITPLGPAEWSFTAHSEKPTLRPSIGNWQLRCRSHYLISAGIIIWAGSLPNAVILEGRRAEEQKREQYYRVFAKKQSFWWRLWTTVKEMLQ